MRIRQVPGTEILNTLFLLELPWKGLRSGPCYNTGTFAQIELLWKFLDRDKELDGSMAPCTEFVSIRRESTATKRLIPPSYESIVSRVRQRLPAALVGRNEAHGDRPLFHGARSRNRTRDILITNQTLFQLSYTG